jgi:predicted nucleotidyltransferase
MMLRSQPNILTRSLLCLFSFSFAGCRSVREVQSLWPRATVQLFGSFVTGLSLPSSDLDLVIGLPKVQKDAPAEVS